MLREGPDTKDFWPKRRTTNKKMSLSVQCSVVEEFHFNGKNFNQYISRECLVPRDVYKATGYEEKNVNKAIQNLVPNKYRLRFGDVKLSLNQG